MKDKKPVQAGLSNRAILGVYEGECADANITNLNGLDITRPVWENVFGSNDYKEGIKYGWYIGFLGHPADADCNDFQNGCIVMTEGHIDENGKIQGKFNLIDTPVGRVVKTFQDAGVTFGISVRGAGDIEDNSVDPDTFVFRGFDLVAFPAYPESIPKFTEIAASTDAAVRKQYQAICASVRENVKDINSVGALEAIQQQFASQSEEYKLIEERKQELQDAAPGVASTADMLQQKVTCMTDLYLEEKAQNTALRHALTAAKAAVHMEKVDAVKRIQSIERIMSAQMKDAQRDAERQVAAAREECAATITAMKNKHTVFRREAIAASRATTRELEDRVASLESQLSQVQSQNLKFRREISAAQQTIEDRNHTIHSLRKDLNKTVVEASTANARAKASNRDASKVKELQASVSELTASLQKYQRAYADLFASASGVDISSVTITASTTLEELQAIIASASDMVTPMSPIFGSVDLDQGLGGDNDVITL